MLRMKIGMTPTESTFPSHVRLSPSDIGRGMFVRNCEGEGAISNLASPDPIRNDTAIGSGVIKAVGTDGWEATIVWRRWGF